MEGSRTHEGVLHGVGGSGTISYTRVGSSAAETDSVSVKPIFTGFSNKSGHKVTGIAYPRVVSSPASGDTYKLGEAIVLSVPFGAPVTVNGSPELNFYLGAQTDTSKALGRNDGSTRLAARYMRGSGTDTLVFGYTVKDGDHDTNGISWSGGGTLFGTKFGVVNPDSVTWANGSAITYHFAAGRNASGHKVDGRVFVTDTEVVSSPSSETYRNGQTFEYALTFNNEVDVEGARHLSLRVGPGDSSGWRGLS